MEEGSLRCDANVSIRPKGSEELGTKTELKNMNSFRFVMQGINAEIERQTALLEAEEPVVQETLHFDPRTGDITSLRSKEEAHDYRYFPEPDLVPLAPTDEMIQAARDALPELPAERAQRYERDWTLPEDTARLFATRPELGDYFEEAATAAEVEAPVVATWLKDELVGRLDAEADPAASNVSPQALAKLAGLVHKGTVTRGAARQVLDRLVEHGGDPAEVVEQEGLGAMGDGDELATIVARVIEEHPDVAERVRGGNPKAIGALVGPVMRETKGRADGGEVNRLLREQLGV
jgi:aspartyl-tRNA(Asn)/glutamyl-tRNA(Gln) amidotransferase subunit B